MASITLQINDDLNAQVSRQLERLGMTPSEYVYQVLRYVADHGELPFDLVDPDITDDGLITTVRERLAAPRRVKVDLNDL
ncbi:type II toxin-antitoxin system RelB/DinJ family antitoxin [Pseudomonas wadenswilerensis]